jgi:uncharacterized phage protein gp47/JayE
MIGSPVAVIDAAGITIPVYVDILDYFQEQYRSIYGADIDLDSDTQDGQWVAILAQAINDANMTIEQIYHAYSPTFAQGAGLSSVVKINGIRRHMASFSSVVIKAIGIAGTDIGNGIVGDNLNLSSQWQLPPNVVIPPEGEISATATSLVSGDVRADIGTITTIITPIPGWQTVTNDVSASPGQPVENDAQLRRRQTYSVANPSQSVLIGIQGAVGQVEGVSRVLAYENASPTTDSNGIPPYSMAVVVEGGNAMDIANAIALRKTPGSPTYGTTSILVTDVRGIPSMINYFDLTLVPVTVEITLTALANFSAVVADQIMAQVVNYISTLPIGYDCYLTKVIAATEIAGRNGLTYEVTQVRQARDNNTLGTSDISISYIEATTTDSTLISFIVNGGPTLRRVARR